AATRRVDRSCTTGATIGCCTPSKSSRSRNAALPPSGSNPSNGRDIRAAGAVPRGTLTGSKHRAMVESLRGNLRKHVGHHHDLQEHYDAEVVGDYRGVQGDSGGT